MAKFGWKFACKTCDLKMVIAKFCNGFLSVNNAGRTGQCCKDVVKMLHI